MIKRNNKRIGKRWQWYPCESFEFHYANWPVKKYVVFNTLIFFAASCFLLLLFTASAAVFFLRTQRTLVHTIHSLLFRSICTRVVIKSCDCEDNVNRTKIFLFQFFIFNVFTIRSTVQRNFTKSALTHHRLKHCGIFPSQSIRNWFVEIFCVLCESDIIRERSSDRVRARKSEKVKNENFTVV